MTWADIMYILSVIIAALGTVFIVITMSTILSRPTHSPAPMTSPEDAKRLHAEVQSIRKGAKIPALREDLADLERHLMGRRELEDVE